MHFDAYPGYKPILYIQLWNVCVIIPEEGLFILEEKIIKKGDNNRNMQS